MSTRAIMFFVNNRHVNEGAIRSGLFIRIKMYRIANSDVNDAFETWQTLERI